MYEKEFLRTLRHAAILAAAAFFLGGCLEEEAADSGDAPPTDPPGNSAPVISGTPSTSVLVGDSYAFTPTASDADNDTLTFTIVNKPGWADFNPSTGELSGQAVMGTEGIYPNIQISVTDGAATDALPVFAISVDQVGNFSTTLSWTAPTQNEDGTALEDLSGYRIYWGRTPGVYTNSVTIDNEGITTYVVDGLSAGTYEFVATSFNSAGVESRYSNPATRTFQ